MEVEVDDLGMVVFMSGIDTMALEAGRDGLCDECGHWRQASSRFGRAVSMENVKREGCPSNAPAAMRASTFIYSANGSHLTSYERRRQPVPPPAVYVS